MIRSIATAWYLQDRDALNLQSYQGSSILVRIHLLRLYRERKEWRPEERGRHRACVYKGWNPGPENDQSRTLDFVVLDSEWYLSVALYRLLTLLFPIAATFHIFPRYPSLSVYLFILLAAMYFFGSSLFYALALATLSPAGVLSAPTRYVINISVTHLNTPTDGCV